MKSLYPKDHLCCYCGQEADDYVIDKGKYVLVCQSHLPILIQEKDADLSNTKRKWR